MKPLFFTLCVFLGLSISYAQSQSTVVWGPKTFQGTLLKPAVYKDQLNVSQVSTQNTYTLNLVNGDGKDHIIKVCTGTFVQRISCEASNLAEKAYIEIFRVDSVDLYVNGVKVGSGSLITNKQATTQIQVPITSLQNALEFRIKGFPTAQIKAVITASINNQPPVPLFTYIVDSALGELKVKLDASGSSDPDQNSLTYNWNFGDSQIAQGVLVEHSYSQPGTYQVVLTVSDGAINKSLTKNISISDTLPPVLSWDLTNSDSEIITNQNPYDLSSQVTSNEKLKSIKVNGQSFSLSPDSLSALIQNSIITEGPQVFLLEAEDVWGNKSSLSKSVNFGFDYEKPLIETDAVSPLTNSTVTELPVTITDSSKTWTDIYVNQNKVFGTGAKRFLANVDLTIEGNNTIQIVSIDQAGNSSDTVELVVKRDTVAPQINISSPLAGQIITQVQFLVSGTSNESLSELTIDNKIVALGEDKKSFSVNYITQSQGAQNLSFQAKDLAGNVSYVTQNISVSSPLLVPELIALSASGNKIYIRGSAGAARPGLEIQASAGTFSLNRDSSTTQPDGSFLLSLEPFTSAQIKVEDTQTGEQASTNVVFSQGTTLSGVVRDINDIAIPNVTVKISGSSLQTVTNGQGAFHFDSSVSGDQTLFLDGSTVPQSFTGPNRLFSNTTISINIGFGQNNALERPIYLTPIILDGTQTQVVANQPTVVESSHAPGVSLEIPSNSTIFPTGANTGAINIITIPADKATTPVPDSMVPSNIISLEPSGLKFTKRVDIKLPNSSELPANTDMVIFSMNSSKGTWEIDGMARVSEDGTTINTLPGEGISHFSLVYAVPMAPEFVGVVDSKLNAVDASKDSYQSVIQIPSFKIGDESFAPKLIYKSNWANPTAYVSNFMEIPENKIEYTRSLTNQTGEYKNVRLGKRCGIFSCKTFYADYYYDTFYQTEVQEISYYRPQAIKSQFFISSIASDEAEFGNIDSGLSYSSSEIFNDAERVGLISQISSSTINNTDTLPMRTVLSYAVELKDPTSGLHLKSGLYPSLARYEVQLKNLTLRSIQQKVTVNSHTSSKYIKESERNFTNVYNYSKTTLESQVLEGFLPKDVSSNIIVQNKVNSEAGQGWHIAGVQKILNPTSNNIVIEEADGAVSTYEVNNTISTLYKPSENVKLTQAVDISQWPKAIVSYVASDGKTYAGEIDLSANSPNIVGLGEIKSYQGNVANQGYYNCAINNYSGTFNVTEHPYKYVSDLGGIIRRTDGTIFGSDLRQHSIFKINSAYSKIIGMTATPNDSQILAFNRVTSMPFAELNSACNTEFGAPCGTPTTVIANKSCQEVRPAVCPPGKTCLDDPKIFWSSNSPIGMATFSDDAIPGTLSDPYASDYYGVNSPRGMTVDSDGNVIFAEYGNNRVRKLNFLTGDVKTILGNGENADFPTAGGSALSVPAYHPKSVTTDSLGNVYVSLEKGIIVKVSPTKQAMRVAGLPIEQGGVYANQSHASVMALSNPTGMLVDEDNNYLYIADTGFNRVVRIDLASNQADVVAGTGACDPPVSGKMSRELISKLGSELRVSSENESQAIARI